ncbi:MAG: hypothetical protein ACE5F7_01485 [Nitrospiria bacterium]
MKFTVFVRSVFVFVLLSIPFPVFSGEIAIIVNAENPVSNLKREDIKQYYLKETLSWPSGAKVRSVDRKGSPPERKAFLKEIVQMSPEHLKKYWVSKRYGKGVPVPPKLGNDMQIIEYVQSFEGAISYINADKVSGTSGIKVVGTVPMP